mgnify:CR=1 FL=1
MVLVRVVPRPVAAKRPEDELMNKLSYRRKARIIEKLAAERPAHVKRLSATEKALYDKIRGGRHPYRRGYRRNVPLARPAAAAGAAVKHPVSAAKAVGSLPILAAKGVGKRILRRLTRTG